MAYWCLVYRWIDSGFIEFSIIRIDGVWLVRTLTHLDTDGGCTTTGHYNLKKSLIGADLRKTANWLISSVNVWLESGRAFDWGTSAVSNYLIDCCSCELTNNKSAHLLWRRTPECQLTYVEHVPSVMVCSSCLLMELRNSYEHSVCVYLVLMWPPVCIFEWGNKGVWFTSHWPSLFFSPS